MEFWYGLYIMLWLFFCIAIYVKENQQKKILYIMIAVVWFIGSFRLNIGTDYATYSLWYDTWSYYDGGTVEIGTVEPGFWVIVTILNALNFKSQMMFFTFESLTILFICKGLKYYIPDSKVLMSAFLLYVVFPTNGGHWWDLNVIRQALAISICFWGTKYLCENNIKIFILTVFFAMMFHYSAILILALLLCRKKLSLRMVYILLASGFVFNATGITHKGVMFVLSYMSLLTGKYTVDYATIDAGGLAFSVMAFIYVVMYLGANMVIHNRISTIIHNGAAIYIILRVYTSFGIEDSILGTVVHRFEAYFMFFYLILLAYAMKFFILTQKNRIFAKGCLLIFMLLFCVVLGMQPIKSAKNDIMSIIGSPSSANIQYEFNFDFFK